MMTLEGHRGGGYRGLPCFRLWYAWFWGRRYVLEAEFLMHGAWIPCRVMGGRILYEKHLTAA
jgi:hypothetical protein